MGLTSYIMLRFTFEEKNIASSFRMSGITSFLLLVDLKMTFSLREGPPKAFQIAETSYVHVRPDVRSRRYIVDCQFEYHEMYMKATTLLVARPICETQRTYQSRGLLTRC